MNAQEFRDKFAQKEYQYLDWNDLCEDLWSKPAMTIAEDRVMNAYAKYVLESQPKQLSDEEATRLADAKYFNDEQEKVEADEETLREYGAFIKGVMEVNSPFHLFVNKEYLTQRNQQEKK